MNNADVFAIILQRNQNSILRATEGLSHSQSLLQLPGESNCMNWILGHIATFRDGILADIRQTEYMTEAEVKMYDYDSPPITINSKSVDFDRLVHLQVQTYDAITGWLQNTPQGLENATRKDSSVKKGYMGYWATVAEHFAQNIGHESIHVGELSALRELALLNLGHQST